MYRLSYTQGNGYRCGCCRKEWSDYTDCETHEEVVKWVVEHMADQQMPRFDESDDFVIEDIEKEIGISLLDQYVEDPKIKLLVDAEVSFRKKKEEEEEEKKRNRKIESKEKKTIEDLKGLIEKYGSLEKIPGYEQF